MKESKKSTYQPMILFQTEQLDLTPLQINALRKMQTGRSIKEKRKLKRKLAKQRKI